MNFDAYIPVLNRLQDIWRDSRKMIGSPRFKTSPAPGSSLAPRSPLWPPKPLTQFSLRPKFSTFLFSLTQNITLHFVSLAKAELACSGCASLACVAPCDWPFRKF